MTVGIAGQVAEPVGLMRRYALYRFYSDNGELLYVGTSGEFGRRFTGHAQKVWFLEVRGITLEWYATEDDALAAERRAIHVEHPKHNVQHRDLKTLSAPVPRTRAARKRPGRSGRDVCLALLASNPGLTNVEIAKKARVSTKTVQRARKELPDMGRAT